MKEKLEFVEAMTTRLIDRYPERNVEVMVSWKKMAVNGTDEVFPETSVKVL